MWLEKRKKKWVRTDWKQKELDHGLSSHDKYIDLHSEKT